jgi:hypothetical protein
MEEQMRRGKSGGGNIRNRVYSPDPISKLKREELLPERNDPPTTWRSDKGKATFDLVAFSHLFDLWQSLWQMFYIDAC